MTMIQYKAAQGFIKEWIRPRLTAFEKRHPEFPTVKFIDDVFELERNRQKTDRITQAPREILTRS
jgi:hypothetical protein